MISLSDVQAAQLRIKNHVIRTSVMTSSTVDGMLECNVFFKCENFQRVGAFKFRGALNTVSLLSDEEKSRGVVTHSSGNHAQALSLAASMLGVKATIVMPKNSPTVKVNATRGYGSEIVFCENNPESRVETCTKLIDEYGYTLVHPYNDERIIAGAGTAALELLTDYGPLDVVMAPVGGGGLLSGTSVATKGISSLTKVIGGEPENADDAFRSFRDGVIYPSIRPNTIADGLRTNLGDITFSVIRANVDRIVTVSEEEILSAMKILWERMKLVVEPSGAVSLAAAIKIKNELKGLRVGIIISGGNVDLEKFFAEFEVAQ
ncbi:MAG: pyridoxal-phosphate dependent enzyme [Candidatus Thorarchaeota archaeon]|nr:pyridoxal-phosphate dependent enzyme [Candidatus Thorarchaeota archaeon]